MKKLKIILFLSLTLVITSCNNGPKVLNEKKISSSEFGDKWPLTVDEGTLQCVQFEVNGVNPEVLRGVIFKTKDKTYSVNGVAASHGVDYGFEEISVITKVDLKTKNEMMKVGVSEKDATIKMDIGFLLEEGLKLCE